MVLLQACLVKQRRGKSTQEGKFVVTDARYSRHLTAVAGELLTTRYSRRAARCNIQRSKLKELQPTAKSIDEVFDMH